MKYTEENIDIMLFDYLEGNLSSDKAEELKVKVDSDPMIREELNSWRKTYIKSELYDTEVLETQLLQAPGSFSFTLFLNSILVICLTLISSSNPTLDPSSTSLTNNQNIYSLTAEQPKSKLSYPIINVEPIQIESTAFIAPPQKDEIKEVEGIEYDFILNPELTKLSLEWIEYPMSHPKSITIYREMDLMRITPKELGKKDKALRRMRKKALRDRKASEFIKGDIPYVVPVNPNNF